MNMKPYTDEFVTEIEEVAKECVGFIFSRLSAAADKHGVDKDLVICASQQAAVVALSFLMTTYLQVAGRPSMEVADVFTMMWKKTKQTLDELLEGRKEENNGKH